MFVSSSSKRITSSLFIFTLWSFSICWITDWMCCCFPAWKKRIEKFKLLLNDVEIIVTCSVIEANCTQMTRPIGGLRARTIPWFFSHFWKCSEVVEFWHVDTFKYGRKIKGLFLLWALQFMFNSWSHLSLTDRLQETQSSANAKWMYFRD